VYKIEQFFRIRKPYLFTMRLEDLTPELVVSVPCPTCGAASERPCLLYSGDPHIDSHIERKFYAAETIELRRGGGLESLPQR